MKWLNLAIGGIAGTFARYWAAGLVHQILGSAFPYGTMIVNLTGCFLIGFLAVLAEEKFLLSPEARLLLMVGFCGAFTTFSTWLLETANLIKDGQSWPAFVNVLASVVIGFAALKVGTVLGKVI